MSDRAESWDDDFEFNTRPGASAAARRLSGAENWDDEFGFADRLQDEDQTVTGRAASHLAPAAHIQQPFPRSPSSSVFSLPTTIAGDPTSYGSTAHLYPSGGTLRDPIVHKERDRDRERRRLRKKSRPQPQGVFELIPVQNGLAALQEVVNGNGTPSPSPSHARNSSQSEAPSPPRTPQTPASTASHTCSITPCSPPVPPPSMSPGSPASATSTKGALLSRIGSVKKWSVVRRKRGTSQTQTRLPDDTNPTRPTSSLSSLPLPTTSSSHQTHVPSGSNAATRPMSFFNQTTTGMGGGGWFFRTGEAATTEVTEDRETPGLDPDMDRRGRSASMVQRARSGRTRSGTSARNRTTTPSPKGPDTPPTLVKKKSSGFVQLGRTRSGFSAGEASSPGVLLPRTPTTSGRHASHGGVVASYKTTQGGPFHKSDIFLDRGPALPPPRVDAAEKLALQEPRKSLIRSVKRVSLVGGRHQRQKSGPPQPELETVPPLLDLLPPIEIRDTPTAPPPPKPVLASELEPDTAAEFETPRKGAPTTTTTTPPCSPERGGGPSTKSPTSPQQSASLGRSAYSPTRNKSSPEEKAAIPRRNSLGDLKIPTRISQAQVGLRRDLGMVKEFANHVDQLRELQGVYHGLVLEIQALLDDQAQQQRQKQASRSVSPSFFSRPVGRKRSITNPGPQQHRAYKQLASAFYTINSKYRIAWECAELLIELGGARSASSSATCGPTTSVSAPAVGQGRGGGDDLSSSSSSTSWAKSKGRERAITLAGDESKSREGFKMLEGSSSSAALVSPTSSTSEMASTAGRQHELNQRQMILLKELLNSADSNLALADRLRPGGTGIPEELPTNTTSVDREWKWGDPSNSTVTLPPSESSSTRPPSSMAGKKERRASKLGMAGLRDLLRMLKRHYTAHPVHPMPSFGSMFTPPSTSSLASTTHSSSDLQYSGGEDPFSSSHLGQDGERPVVTYGRRRAKTSFGPEDAASTRDLPLLYEDDATPLPARQRRRPSLASIFRIPNSLKPSKVTSLQPDHEDWDRVDSCVELDGVAAAAKRQNGVCVDVMMTVRGKGRSPYLQQPMLPLADSSRTSLYDDSQSGSSHNGNVVLARLSNVDEEGGGAAAQARAPSRIPPSPSSSSHAGMPWTPPPPRTSSRYYGGKPKALKNGSVRSMPPQPMPELRLAMTPENIKPLVENAKDVHATLVECIAEIRSLLENYRLKTAGGR